MSRLGWRFIPVRSALAAALMLFAAGCGSSGERSSGVDLPAPGSFLAARGLPSGWSAGDSVHFYSGNELFELINGGADLYLEYGFVKSATRSFIGPEGALVLAGIYEMSSTDAAFGIFSAFRKMHYETVEIGTAGAVSNYQLIFCKGPYFVDIQSMGGVTENQASIRALARSIESSINAPASPLPAVLNLLPRTDLAPGSETLVRGALGLNACYYLSDRNLFDLGSSIPGVLGKYITGGDPEPLQLLAVRYPDRQTAQEVFSRLVEFYRQRAGTRPGSLFDLRGISLVYGDERGEDAVTVRERNVYALFAAPEGAALSALEQILGD